MYIYPVNTFKLIPSEDLSKYLQKDYSQLCFNTNDGIYEIMNDKIYKYNEAPETTLYDFSKEHKFRIQQDHHTKYEKTRILGIRAKQINNGAKPLVTFNTQIIDGYLIALKELEEKKIPIIIRRPIPNGASEYWHLKDLEILQ